MSPGQGIQALLQLQVGLRSAVLQRLQHLRLLIRKPLQPLHEPACSLLAARSVKKEVYRDRGRGR
eukprot:26277-Eustigmatos_ZCMA.PRE.1